MIQLVSGHILGGIKVCNSTEKYSNYYLSKLQYLLDIQLTVFSNLLSKWISKNFNVSALIHGESFVVHCYLVFYIEFE